MPDPLMPRRDGWLRHRSQGGDSPIAFDGDIQQTGRKGGRLVANSLLDFVMALVRDPDAAAHYAANPAQAIADANLTDVTSADVNHLIPVVAESMSTVVPSAAAGGVLDDAHNVWASGAATAAFDAFDDHLPIRGADVVAAHVPTVANVIQQPEDGAPTIVDHGFDGFDDLPEVGAVSPSDHALAYDVPVVDESHAADAGQVDDLHHGTVDDHPQDPGFDIFA